MPYNLTNPDGNSTPFATTAELKAYVADMAYRLTEDDGDTQRFNSINELQTYVAAMTDVVSPTGREPRLVWTRAQQAVWARMRAEHEAGQTTLGAAWYALILAKAAQPLGYGETGLWQILAYQMTGDLAWAAEAWARITGPGGFLTKTQAQLFDDNGQREYCAEYVLHYDWLYPALTEEQRAQYLAQLDVILTDAVITKAVRTNDTDQVTGVYSGALFYAIAAGAHHPHALTILNAAGGTLAGGLNRDTLRNALADWVAECAGGEWCESGGYNPGTMKLLAVLAAGVRPTGLAAEFADLLAWIESAGLRASSMLTPGLEDPIQWGDDQSPRAAERPKWLAHAMLFDHPVSRDLVYRMRDAWGAVTPLPRGFLTFDPYGPRAPQPRTFWSPGQGILSARTSLEMDASVLFGHFPQRPKNGYPDHTINYLGDVQLWRAREWALTHPISYGGQPNGWQGTNTMCHGGFGATIEFRGATVHAEGDDWQYLCGTTGGQVVAEKYYNPPPPFIYEWTRSVLYLHADDVDVVVFCDRSHCVDPRTLTRYEKYSAANRTKIETAIDGTPGGLKQWLLHMPVDPVLRSNEVSQ